MHQAELFSAPAGDDNDDDRDVRDAVQDGGYDPVSEDKEMAKRQIGDREWSRDAFRC